MKGKPNEAHLLMADLLAEMPYEWRAEYKIVPERKWAWDFACGELRLAVEIHGGIHIGGRHTRGAGFQRDREKMNAGIVAGWATLEFSTEDVLRGRAEKTIKEWLAARAA